MFNDGCSFLIEEVIIFHDHSMAILFSITCVILYNIITLLLPFSIVNRFFLEDHIVETLWTIFPMFILVFIGLPSLSLLYLIDEVGLPSLTVKVTGHQWYWRYEYSDFVEKEFDSFMLSIDGADSQFRLLDVDRRLSLPMLVDIRVLVTSMDVIHAWTVPSLGVKVDAIPGRLNQLRFIISQSGLYFGQCSEICGANHRFIPIVLESIRFSDFVNFFH